MKILANTQSGFIVEASEIEMQKLFNNPNPVIGNEVDITPFMQKINWLSNNINKLTTFSGNLRGFADNLDAAVDAVT